jgi:pantoate--beta-alanine ligase
MGAESKNDPLPEALMEARTLLSDNGFVVDYIEVADAETLEVLSEWNNRPKVILAAAIIDDVRLIDNLVMD